MESRATRSAVERLEAGERLLRTAQEALAAEAPGIEVSVVLQEETFRLRLVDLGTGWQVVLAFRNVEPPVVRARVMDAVRLRSWNTAPPVVRVVDRDFLLSA